jgi:glycosyltransferase involved in cell wall biosynthesis
VNVDDPGCIGAVVDVHALQVDGYANRGIGRYVAGYAAALARTGRLLAALLAPDLPPPYGLPAELTKRDLIRWDSLGEARRLISQNRPLAYHVTAPFLHCGLGEPATLAVVPHWAESGVARVVTVYDLIPLRAPRHYLPTAAHEERYRARARWVAAADLVLTISDHTRREVMELLDCPPEQVVTVGTGVSPFFSPADATDQELWAFHFGMLEHRPFLLTVSGSDTRKATERLIGALGRLAERGSDLHLLVVGDLTPA